MEVKLAGPLWAWSKELGGEEMKEVDKKVINGQRVKYIVLENVNVLKLVFGFKSKTPGEDARG